MHKFQLQAEHRATNFVPRANSRSASSVLLLGAIVAAIVTLCASRASAAESASLLRYEIVATHPHDPSSFTQGLAILDGEIVESRGLTGKSAVTVGAIATGVPRLRRAVGKRYFAEGLAIADRRVVQLTWHSGIAFVYDTALKPVGQLKYEGEGWGLAYDGEHWRMSDGSDRIVSRRRDDFAPVGEIRITDQGQPVAQLNELEYAQGRLYANVWHSDRVAVIAPGTGKVEAWIDFAALRQGFSRPPGWDENEHVLNGIAFNPANGHFYVTGKCWPVLFEIRLQPQAP